MASTIPATIKSAALGAVHPAGVGTKLPDIQLKQTSPDDTLSLASLKGRNLILGVPGAFTPPCSNMVPQFSDAYSEITQKGIKGVYVVPINDVFASNAWKEKLGCVPCSLAQDAKLKAGANRADKLNFLADDTGAFSRTLGLTFDATGLLGGERAKRYVLLTNDDTIEKVFVEDEAPNVEKTTAKAVLAAL
ncbi:uncharacterized protein L969DRAFT_623154 [Mixia osmundae IAM 14324]|uniref:uncharacterized protein n=1 Tax=Mixia osmundae (strain CBS 9802 / IAM 14324 / JCM 22182 / KY 12970) TaxID=764103 RepID=UPI0004A553BC|nr:uncharacterized protein L969DRAFT_623154 [Mixia osmundae IAM 14324]KEI39642.1 hypothetical protein L969DRAFT_623154 [Mixia osmundae IAM 14324]